MSQPIANNADGGWTTVKSDTQKASRMSCELRISNSPPCDCRAFSISSGTSGGKRNAKSKYQSAHGRTIPTGQAIQFEHKLLDIAAESEWFLGCSEATRTELVQAIRTVIEKQISEMLTTDFFHALLSQLNQTRQSLQCYRSCTPETVSGQDTCMSTTVNEISSSHSIPTLALAANTFDIVIYGIGRYCEWSIGRLAASDLTAGSITPSFLRSSIRSCSRSPQLQLACILAVARTQTNPSLSTSPLPPSTVDSTSTSVASSSFRMHMFDPMLSELEKAIAVAFGIEIIPMNEEGPSLESLTSRPGLIRRLSHHASQSMSLPPSLLGKREITRPTLFYMPHCPQTLYNNVLWANWGLNLSHLMILGNSLKKYVDASASTSSSSSGYLRGGGRKKKKSEFASKLATDPICCNHDHPPQITDSGQHQTMHTTSPTQHSATASPPESQSSSTYPYPCLALIGPILREMEVRNSHESQTVFNDLNLHHFVLEDDLVCCLLQPSATIPTSDPSPSQLSVADAALKRLLTSFHHRPPPASMLTDSSSQGDSVKRDMEMIYPTQHR